MIVNKSNLHNASKLKLNVGLKAQYDNQSKQNTKKLLILVNVSCWILSLISIICIVFTFMPIISILNEMHYPNIHSILNNQPIDTSSILIGAKQFSANKNLIRSLIFNFSDKSDYNKKDSFQISFGSELLSICANSYGEFYRLYMYCYFYLIQTIHKHSKASFFSKKNKLDSKFIEHANKFFISLSEKQIFYNNKILNFIFNIGEKFLDIDSLINQLLSLIHILSPRLSEYQRNIWSIEINKNKPKLKDYEIRDVLLLFNEIFVSSKNVVINKEKINELYNSGTVFDNNTLEEIVINVLSKENDCNNDFLKIIKIRNEDIALNKLLHIAKLLIEHKQEISENRDMLRDTNFRFAISSALTDLNILQNINNEMSLSLDNIQNRLYMYNEFDYSKLHSPYQTYQDDMGNIFTRFFGWNKVEQINNYKEKIITDIFKRASQNNLHGLICKSGLEAYLRNHYRIEFEEFEKDIGNFCVFSTWNTGEQKDDIVKYLKPGTLNDIIDTRYRIREKLKEINRSKSKCKIGRDSYSYGDIISFVSTLDRI